MTPYQLEFIRFIAACILSGIALAIALELIDRRKVHQAPPRSRFFGK